jgi:hypothetical protein
MKTPGAPHEDFSKSIVGAYQAVLDAEPAAKCQRPRLLGEKRVGARLDEKSAGMLGRDGAAEPVARFDDRQLQTDRSLTRELDRAVGGREPGDATGPFT